MADMHAGSALLPQAAVGSGWAWGPWAQTEAGRRRWKWCRTQLDSLQFGLDDPRVQTCPQETVIIFMVTFKRWAYLTHSHGLPSL